MSTIIAPPMTSPAAPMTSPVSPPLASVYRMDVDEFEQIAHFLKTERVELIDGLIVERGVMDTPHVLASEKLRRKLDRLVPEGWFVREDKPLRVHGSYEPFPDLAVVQGDPETYEDEHPGPADVALVVEISDSTLTKDRGEKWVNYAKGGISVYWIVNLVNRQVEVYTGPGPDGYSVCDTFTADQSVQVVIDGAEVGQVVVSEILPRLKPAAGGNGA